MTRTYSIVIEGDEAGYSGYVPELPSILVTGRTTDELMERASQAIRIYWESVREGLPAAAITKEIEVELAV